MTDFHAWQICSEITVATAHVAADAETADEFKRTVDACHDALYDLGVDHATVELYPTADRGLRLDAHEH